VSPTHVRVQRVSSRALKPPRLPGPTCPERVMLASSMPRPKCWYQGTCAPGRHVVEVRAHDWALRVVGVGGVPSRQHRPGPARAVQCAPVPVGQSPLTRQSRRIAEAGRLNHPESTRACAGSRRRTPTGPARGRTRSPPLERVYDEDVRGHLNPRTRTARHVGPGRRAAGRATSSSESCDRAWPPRSSDRPTSGRATLCSVRLSALQAFWRATPSHAVLWRRQGAGSRRRGNGRRRRCTGTSP